MSNEGDYSESWQQSRSHQRVTCQAPDLYQWNGDRQPEQGDVNSCTALIGSLTNQDFYRWSGAQSGRSCHDLPDLNIDRWQESQIATLSDSKAPEQEKLAAAEALAKDGVSNFNMVDENGKERHARLELEQCQGKQLLHLFADDDHGRQRVLLRAVCNGDGSYLHQRNRHGNHVSFSGTWWTANMRHRSHQAVPKASI